MANVRHHSQLAHTKRIECERRKEERKKETHGYDDQVSAKKTTSKIHQMKI